MIEKPLSDDDFKRVTKFTSGMFKLIDENYPNAINLDPKAGGMLANQMTMMLAVVLGMQARCFGASASQLEVMVKELVSEKLVKHAVRTYEELDPSSPTNRAFDAFGIGKEPTQKELSDFMALVEIFKTDQGGKPN